MNDIFDDVLMKLSANGDSNSVSIPLLTSEEEERMFNTEFPSEIPILPLRNNVLFPGVVIPITVGRDKSIELIKYADKKDKIIGVISQKNEDVENPGFKDLHKIGTVATILRLLKMPDGTSTAII